MEIGGVHVAVEILFGLMVLVLGAFNILLWFALVKPGQRAKLQPTLETLMALGDQQKALVSLLESRVGELRAVSELLRSINPHLFDETIQKQAALTEKIERTVPELRAIAKQQQEALAKQLNNLSVIFEELDSALMKANQILQGGAKTEKPRS